MSSSKAQHSAIPKQTNKRLPFATVRKAIELLTDITSVDFNIADYEELITEYKAEDPYGLDTPPETKVETNTDNIITVGGQPDGSANSVHLNIENITQAQIDEFNKTKSSIPCNNYIKKINTNITRLGFQQ